MTEAASVPWGLLGDLVAGPLHPGGTDATAALLDRAAVGPDTRLIDVGCGAGEGVALAADRRATTVGVDLDPEPGTAVRGEMTALPVGTGAVDVVLAECTLCLADDLDAALAEAGRVLGPDGRLALSDVVVAGDLPPIPAELATALCLTGRGDRAWLLERIEAAGFDVRDPRDHREDLLAMRDRLAHAVDYRGLLATMGDRGEALADGIERVEAAVEDGQIGYVSVVADRVE